MSFIDELATAIENIQYDISESTEGIEYFDILLTTNGCTHIVEFLNIRIWNSEDDMRDEDEYGNKENIEQYLRKAIMEEVDKISKIKV